MPDNQHDSNMANAETKDQRSGVATTILFASIMAGAGFSLHHEFFHDDAYITLRYCQNWISGDGIVWNGGERVEGYTSFLHLALIALVGKLGGDLPAISRAIGITSFVAICWIIGVVFRPPRLIANYSPRSILILLIPASFPLIAWSVGGLETALYTALLMLLCYRYSQFDLPDKHQTVKLIGFGLLLAFLTLTRPEAILFVIITCLFTLLRRGWKFPSWNRCAVLSLSFLGLWVPYFLWRWHYYGDLLPNTYYVKMDTDLLTRLRNGFHYLHTFARMPPYLLPLGLITGLFAILRLRTPNDSQLHLLRPVSYMFTIACTGTLYVCYTGGDHMPAYRFIVPLLPIYAWLIAISLPIIMPRLIGQNRWLALAILMLLVLLQIRSSNAKMLDARQPDPAAAVGKDVGIWISENLPPQSSIALNTAGSTPFHAPRQRFIDMLGLNDRYIAHRQVTDLRTWWQQFPGHAKGDGQYVLGRRPDFIILGPAQGLPANAEFANSKDVVWFLSDQELAESPEFTEQYRMRKIKFQAHSGKSRTLVFYERKAGS